MATRAVRGMQDRGESDSNGSQHRANTRQKLPRYDREYLCVLSVRPRKQAGKWVVPKLLQRVGVYYLLGP